ncbi:MAG: glucose-1-phosphate cytidylyltransferase [Gemmatimonadaceae bacterium]
MKVVIFCGGLGLRMRSEQDAAPKPMAHIGERPVLWHVMRYYAHFGHKEFILCLGYGALAVKNYFLDYQEHCSNDFVLSEGGARTELLNSDIDGWKITFVDTGIDTAIGERLRRVRPHLGNDETFLANYGDVLTDAPLDRVIAEFMQSNATASLLAVPPQASFHVLRYGADFRIDAMHSVSELALRENGGYFIFRRDIFGTLHEGEDLVADAFPRLAAVGKLLAIPHDGFWAPMDTMKERLYLEQLHAQGRSPWEVWSPRAVSIPTVRPTGLPVESMYVPPGPLARPGSRAITHGAGGAA